MRRSSLVAIIFAGLLLFSMQSMAVQADKSERDKVVQDPNGQTTDLQVHEGDRSPGSGSWMGSPDPQKLVSATCELDTTDQHTDAGWVDKSGNLIDPSQAIAPPGTADGPFLPLPICHTLAAAAQPGIQWAIDQEAVVAQHLQGGSIDAHPNRDHQLCNLQTLFFI
ncbi:MAG: hypothetical protein ACREN8_12150, partial [Candidatus Dormibacteraceae bacterium]